MTFEFLSESQLATIYIGLLGLSVLLYAILDGYDLGVGVLLPSDNQEQRDRMIASIGPYWDANETWLVLAIGLLLIAFPTAHSLVLQALYIPATIMLAGLILRGVSFDFRAKVKQGQKAIWDKCFKAGSLITTLAQGYMLGLYVTGLETSIWAHGFAVLSALGVTAAYAFIGACWLILKTEHDLQLRAYAWAKTLIWVLGAGIIAVSLLSTRGLRGAGGRTRGSSNTRPRWRALPLSSRPRPLCVPPRFCRRLRGPAARRPGGFSSRSLAQLLSSALRLAGT